MNDATSHPQVMPAAPEHTLKLRTLDEHLCSDHSFASALARAVGAIAVGEDGSLTLASSRP